MLCAFLISPLCYKYRPLQPLSFNQPNNFMWRVQIMKSQVKKDTAWCCSLFWDTLCLRYQGTVFDTKMDLRLQRSHYQSDRLRALEDLVQTYFVSAKGNYFQTLTKNVVEKVSALGNPTFCHWYVLEYWHFPQWIKANTAIVSWNRPLSISLPTHSSYIHCHMTFVVETGSLSNLRVNLSSGKLTDKMTV
jgi:hypothetical protein